MKRFAWLFLLPFLFFGCGKKDSSLKRWMEPNERLKVLASTAMIGDLVCQIGGEEIDFLCLIKGDIDPHSYELVKGDDEKIKTADLIFYNGLGLEHGASVRYHFENQSKAIALGEYIFQEQPDRLVVVDGQIDPHIWMDMELFSETITPIVDALSAKDPAHAALFKKRGKLLKETLLERDRVLRGRMNKIADEKRYLVTSHDAFHYFTRHYLASPGEKTWEHRVNAPQGLAPDSQMSVLDIHQVSEFLCKKQIQVVFPESNVNTDSLKKIVSVCQAKGHDVRVAETPLYGDSMAGVDSYLEMIEHNILTLTTYFEEEL